MTKKKPIEEHKYFKQRLEAERQNSIWHRIKLCETREEKEDLVRECNGLGYMFGWHLRAWKGWMDYQDNMRWQYIGVNQNQESEETL
jgi:hypothetical protein